jgi:hypothetical protein
MAVLESLPAFLAFANSFILIEMEGFEDTIGDDEFVDVDEIESMTGKLQLINCFAEDGGFGRVVEVRRQPGGEEMKNFCAKLFDGPDWFNSVPVFLFYLISENGNEILSDSFIDMHISKQDQRRNELIIIGVTLEVYLRMLVLISFVRTSLKCAKI